MMDPDETPMGGDWRAVRAGGTKVSRISAFSREARVRTPREFKVNGSSISGVLYLVICIVH